jgi:hypothetical protein
MNERNSMRKEEQMEHEKQTQELLGWKVAVNTSKYLIFLFEKNGYGNICIYTKMDMEISVFI